MNCHAAKKRISLFVGGELAEAKSEKVRRHLAACPDCRADAEELERSRLAVRGMAGAGAGGDWTAAEWSRMIRTITEAPDASRIRPAVFKLRPILAGALGVLVMAGLLILQKELRSPAAPETGSFAVTRQDAQPVIPPPVPTKDPDVTSVTIVSPDSGLKILWFYNKKFEWQGYGK
jgi:anti-sigma factor RsiW